MPALSANQAAQNSSTSVKFTTSLQMASRDQSAGDHASKRQRLPPTTKAPPSLPWSLILNNLGIASQNGGSPQKLFWFRTILPIVPLFQLQPLTQSLLSRLVLSRAPLPLCCLSSFWFHGSFVGSFRRQLIWTDKVWPRQVLLTVSNPVEMAESSYRLRYTRMNYFTMLLIDYLHSSTIESERSSSSPFSNVLLCIESKSFANWFPKSPKNSRQSRKSITRPELRSVSSLFKYNFVLMNFRKMPKFHGSSVKSEKFE